MRLRIITSFARPPLINALIVAFLAVGMILLGGGQATANHLPGCFELTGTEVSSGECILSSEVNATGDYHIPVTLRITGSGGIDATGGGITLNVDGDFIMETDENGDGSLIQALADDVNLNVEGNILIEEGSRIAVESQAGGGPQEIELGALKDSFLSPGSTSCKKGFKVDTVQLLFDVEGGSGLYDIEVRNKKDLIATSTDVALGSELDIGTVGSPFKGKDLKIKVMQGGQDITKDIKVHSSCSKNKDPLKKSPSVKNGVSFTTLSFTTAQKGNGQESNRNTNEGANPLLIIGQSATNCDHGFKVDTLRLRFDVEGGSGLYDLEVKDKKNVIASLQGVSLGTEFDVGTPGQLFHGNDIVIEVSQGGVEITHDLKIHVSCSKDPFHVTPNTKDGVSFDTLDFTTTSTGAGSGCDGGFKVDTLRLLFEIPTGSGPYDIEVEDKDIVVATFQDVALGSEIDVGTEGQRFDDANIEFRVLQAGQIITQGLKIHVSCSKDPIEESPNVLDGVSFTTLDFTTTNKSGNSQNSDTDESIVVGFDLSSIAVEDVQSARLVLTINEENLPANWGTAGGNVDVHRLLEDWAEGTGKHAGLSPSQNSQGSGQGVTWNCSTDLAIENQQVDCNPQWNGGLFNATSTDSVLHSNGLIGPVEWDVTEDVVNSADSWIVRRATQSGSVRYYSKEHTDATSNPDLAPRLVLTLAGGGGQSVIGNITIDAVGLVEIVGPEPADDEFDMSPDPEKCDFYAISASPSDLATGAPGGTVSVFSSEGAVLGGAVFGIRANGCAIEAGKNNPGNLGGIINLRSDGGILMIEGSPTLRAVGDYTPDVLSIPEVGVGRGGVINIQSFNSGVIWAGGFGDVRPTGTGEISIDGGIAITSCFFTPPPQFLGTQFPDSDVSTLSISGMNCGGSP